VTTLLAFPETRWQRFDNGEVTSSNSSRVAGGGRNTEKVPDSPTALQAPDVHNDQTSDAMFGKGQPGRKQFYLYSTARGPTKVLFSEFVAPWKLFAFPIVDFAALVVAWSASSFLIVNLTQSQAFSAAPYKYTPQTIGLFNFAVVVGQMVGLATAGPLSDYISMRATKRNNGLREPEMRLPAMIPYTMVMILGNFVVGFGYQYGWDWRVGARFLSFRFLQPAPNDPD